MGYKAHQTKVPNKQIINLKFLSDSIELSLHKFGWKGSRGIGSFVRGFFFHVYHPSLCQSVLLIWRNTFTDERLSTYYPWADHKGSLISTPPLRWIKWDRRRWRKCLKVYNIDYNYVKHQINLIDSDEFTLA